MDLTAEIIGVVGSVGAGIWGLIKFVFLRMDKKFESETIERKKIEEELRTSVDGIKTDFLRKDDFNRELSEVKARINHMDVSITTRLDNITNLILQIPRGPAK